MTALREINRLRYLEAMGVPVYVSRRVLPGAAPSERFFLREDAKKTEPEPRTPAGGAAPEKRGTPSPSSASPPAAQALRESLRQDSGKRQTPSSPLAAPAAEKQAVGTAADQAPRFRLAAIVCGKRLWLEELGSEALAQEQLQLVSAMARALSHPGTDEGAPAVTEFRWPLHGNAQLGLGTEDAAATLQGFLSRQLEENACVELICLGDASKALLADLRVSCARRLLPSTRDVLANPLSKRDVWRTLRA